MIFCANCGAQSEGSAVFCPRCGATMNPAAAGARPGGGPPADRRLDDGEKVAIFFGNLCISPLLGVILYLVWKDETPLKSKDVCRVTLWNVAFGVLLVVLMMVFTFILAAGG